ncbi:hypothetical protein Ctob_012321, partial [Chrysochromulina tobinii]
MDRASSTIVQLPADCDTLEEVIPYIQKKLQLDKRMLFVAELFTPTGDLINSWDQLVQAAQTDTPIIIGCGEPFDAMRVPNALLEMHLNGGGRKAVKRVTRELKDKRLAERQDRAEMERLPSAAAFDDWARAAVAEQLFVPSDSLLLDSNLAAKAAGFGSGGDAENVAAAADAASVTPSELEPLPGLPPSAASAEEAMEAL